MTIDNTGIMIDNVQLRDCYTKNKNLRTHFNSGLLKLSVLLHYTVYIKYST